MNAERWNQLKQAFGDAFEARGALVAQGSARTGDAATPMIDDLDLRGEVEELLAVDAAAGDALESPAWAMHSSQGLPGTALQEGEDEPQTLSGGQRVGGYSIERLIGRGGMGEVYRAMQESPKRAVALKVIRAGLASRRAIKRLEIEATILARLDHPGIARVIEAGEIRTMSRDGVPIVRPFFSMELVEGVSITRHAHELGLSIAARIELMRNVCDAVEHAHQRGVIHRDLKPANILVDEHRQPRVLDFGVARIVDRDAWGMGAHSLTQPGIAPGTLAYMSPEQVGGAAPKSNTSPTIESRDAMSDAADTRSDVYALGVVLYELLTGRLPINPAGKSPLEMMLAVRVEQPLRPSLIRRELRGDLDLIVLAALDKDPARRYSSAGALREDLGRFLRGDPIIIRPASAGYLLRVFAKRRWRELAAAGLALAIGLGTTAWQFARALRAEQVAQTRLVEIRRSADELVFELCGKLNTFSSVAEAQQFLAGEAKERLERLAGETGDDPETLWSLSKAYLRLGMVTGHPGVPNAGHRDQALKLIRRSYELGERVLAMQPESFAHQSGVAHVAVSLAHAVLNREESAPLMARSLQLSESLVRASPGDLGRRADLAYRLVGDGDLRGRAGEAFEAPFARAEEIIRGLVAQAPTDTRWTDLLGCSLGVHAEALGRVDLDTSVAKYEECRAVMTTLLAAQTPNYSAIRHIAKADGALALQHAARGRRGEAASLASGAIAAIRVWMAKEPNNSMYRLDLIDALLIAARVTNVSTQGAPPAVAFATEARELLQLAGSPEHMPPEEFERLGELERLMSALRPATPAR
ncbi:MAG: serine/threonine-protein kinase [Planctomycetota bacterium]